MTAEELQSVCVSNGLTVTATMIERLAAYAALLSEKNQHVNLISRKDIDNVLDKHILHSLTLLMPQVSGVTIPSGSRILDVGTGGGLPGIPLAIIRADIEFVLCDSIQKKITAVNEFIAALKLTNITAVCCRCEELAADSAMRKSFDHIISRAAAPLDELIRWTKNLRKNGAALIALKGGDLREEIQTARKNNDVLSISEAPIDLIGYDGFVRDEKKIVHVMFSK